MRLGIYIGGLSGAHGVLKTLCCGAPSAGPLKGGHLKICVGSFSLQKNQPHLIILTIIQGPQVQSIEVGQMVQSIRIYSNLGCVYFFGVSLR